jgi:excisionase family DNA binding protein
MDKNYLTVTEAATLLNISDRAVRQRISANTIQADKVGNAWHIDSAQFVNDEPKTLSSDAMIEFLVAELKEKNRQLAEQARHLENLQRLWLNEQAKQIPWWRHLIKKKIPAEIPAEIPSA